MLDLVSAPTEFLALSVPGVQREDLRLSVEEVVREVREVVGESEGEYLEVAGWAGGRGPSATE